MRELTLNDMEYVSGAGTVSDVAAILGSRFGIPGSLAAYMFGKHIEDLSQMSAVDAHLVAFDIEARVARGEYVPY